MKKAFALLTAAVLIAAVGSGVADEKKAVGEKPQVVIHKHTDLVGKAVRNKNNDHLGYVEDIVVAVPSGRLAYVSFSTKNALGLGGKLYALPMSAFGMAADYSHLTLAEATKNDFDSAPAFDANAWPDKVANERFTKWGKQREPINMKKDHHLLRITSINGLAVRNSQGEDLGKIHGFAVDCTHDRISYGALTYGGVAGVGTKYFAIPWEAMTLKPLNLRLQDCCFVLNATKGDFDRPGFENTTWPNQGDQRFLKNAPKTSSR